MGFPSFPRTRKSLRNERQALEAALKERCTEIANSDASDSQIFAQITHVTRAESLRLAELDRQILAKTSRRDLERQMVALPEGVRRSLLNLELMRRPQSPPHLKIGVIVIYTMLALIALAFYLTSQP